MFDNKVFIIAEAGVNHNGDINIAYKMIDKAVEAKVDAIKFQTFKSEKLVSKFANKAEYQKKTTGKEESQLEMIRKLELNFREFEELNNYCKHKKIMFLSTGFDSESIQFLNGLGMEIFKIPSGELNNLPYLIEIAKLNKKVIISTGMSNIEEIGTALEILKKYGTKEISVLHCNTEYPTPMKDVNLLAMHTIKNKFDVEVGYSDHTIGVEVPIAAVALGARVIEKHFTLDNNMEGPDHKASIESEELKELVKKIRNTEMALGSSNKIVTESEKKNKEIARRSIVAKTDIKIGEIFSEKNITVKRPGNGIGPENWFKVIGKIAKSNFVEDEQIKL